MCSYETESNNNILDEENESIQFDNQFRYSWENEYFKKFEWLNSPQEMTPSDMDTANPHHVFSSFLAYMGIEPEKTVDPAMNKLYTYFISLENDKMFLYTDFKEDESTIIKKAEERFQYMQIHRPCKIVFTLETTDVYDVDKYVKQFMHMFGVNNVRGGSYVDITLDQKTLEFIENEREIACLEYYCQD